MLLAFMLVGMSSAWGQTTISTFSMPTDDPTDVGGDRYYLGDNGGVTYYAQDLKDNDGKFSSIVISGKTYRKLQDNEIDNAHIKLQFAKGTIKAGDILSVTCADVYNDNGRTVGYKVGGSNATVTGSFSGTPLTLQHTISASEIIDNGDNTNEYIRIGRNSYLDAYGTITVTRPDFTVTFSPTVAGRGTVTATANGSTLTSGQSVPNGTEVTFTAAANSGFMTWRWEGDVTGDAYTTETKVTVTKNINVQYNFTQGITLNAYVRNGGGSVVVVNGSNQGNTLTVNPWPGDATFKATPNAGYMLEGWYTNVECTNKVQAETDKIEIDGNNVIYKSDYFSTDGMTINLWANLVPITHPNNITCVNNTIDLSKITVGWGGATYDPSSHAGSITDNWGAISVKFASAIDLHELSTLTLAGTNVEKTDNAGAFNGVTFKCEGGDVSEYNYPFSLSSRSDEDKEKLKKVTAIEFVGDDTDAHKGNFTLTAITLNFGGSHTKPSTPTLINGTKDGMVIGAGCPFTLSASNGYWREYKSDYSGEKDGGLISDVYAPTHTFESGLTAGDYYFGIQDYIGQACDFGVQHRSDLTRTHVKVVAATPNVTCQDATIDKSKLYVYGDATYDGNTGQFVVNNYNTYGNGLKIVFASPQDLSYAKTITINGAEFKNPNMTEAGVADTRWPNVVAEGGKTVINLNNKGNANYDAVTEIDLRDIQAGTYTISSIDIEFDHTPAKPELVNGTTATMVLPEGKTLKLSANNVDDTFWREYTAIGGTQKYDRILASEYNTPVREISGLTQGTYYFAAERRRICEFGQTHYSPEITWVTVEVEPVGTIPNELALIKQPIFGQNHTDMAKEYIAIAKLQASNGDDVKGWTGDESQITVTGIAYKMTTDDKSSLTDEEKRKIAYVLGSHEYKVTAENGLCISQWGRAGLIEGQAALPTRATLMLKAAGTMDFYILAKNTITPADGSNESRRHIKVWYTNNQNVDANGDRILMPFKCANNNTNNDFNFYGERLEDNSNGLTPLQVSVRLQHLGSDGTCNVFITYEDDVKDENVWIKGILVKRPDLKVTIGRTDKLRYTNGNYNNKNCELTPYGENQPYQWNFGTAGFSAMDPETNNEVKKVNEHDGRTYICGVGPNGEQLMDHLLVYSDGRGETKESKANFDGRKITNGKHTGYESDESDNNEHIEFLHPTKYSGQNAYRETQSGFDEDRRSFRPILSNGLKVNVTGSGWFTIACAAPNGAVKMKVLSSTNYGTSYINLLREFDVPKSSSDTDWQTYRVYLKAHNDKNGDEGFWHGSDNVVKAQLADYSEVEITDPEEYQMSLYVVFDATDDESRYDEGKAQLNIHYMQWINELPGDYVFQQEEDPKLLNTLQSVVEGGTVEKPGLYWQAGNDNMWESEANKAVIPTVNTTTKSYPSAYNSGSYTETKDGQDSGDNTISQQLGIKWDVAAKALTESHTEAAATDATAGYNYVDATQYALPTNTTNEFDIPISGSFFRFMPMKNQYVSTWIVPTDGAKIFVLDETGQPIPFIDGGDMQSGNISKINAVSNARERGWVAYAQGLTAPTGDQKHFTAGTSTAVRIDFAALAGKEYFIVSKDGRISLARLKATKNAYRANMEEAAQALTLENDATTNTTAISNAMSGTGRYATSVTLNRDFTAGNWASLVLPFSMNEKKFEEVFGKDAICLHFTDVDKTDNTVQLTHHFYNMIVAGRPVLVRPSDDGSIFTSKTISDVTLQASAVVPNVNGDFTFTGSYDNATMPANSLFISGNAVKHASAEKTGVKALRAWFVCPDLSETPSAGVRAAMFINYDGTLMDEDMATGIETALAESGMDAAVISASTVIYNLQGNKVATGAELNNLPAGVYVVKGKKFIVK